MWKGTSMLLNPHPSSSHKNALSNSPLLAGSCPSGPILASRPRREGLCMPLRDPYATVNPFVENDYSVPGSRQQRPVTTRTLAIRKGRLR